jgi:gluconolactonase
LAVLPESLTPEVFARLPAGLRNTTNPVIRNGVGRDCFLEGPSFGRDGTLYCVDIPNGRVLAVGADGGFRCIAQYDGHPNGLKIHRDGRIFIADRRRGLMVIAPGSDKVEPFIETAFAEPFRGLNDLVFAADGTLYFTDQGQSDIAHPTGRLFRRRPDGSLRVLFDNLASPNGVALSADGSSLFLAVTRANAVWRISLTEAGGDEVGRASLYLQLSGGIGPDGLAVSANDDLLVGQVGSGSVLVFNKAGDATHRIAAPQGRLVTNLAFRPGTNQLYFIESETGTILRASMPFEGLPLYSHA